VRQHTRGSWIGWLFVLTLLGHASWNVYAFQRNQVEFPPDQIVRPRSRQLEVLAAESSMTVVRHTFASYHRIARRFAGKTFVIGDDHLPHRFSLERMARVNVEVVSGRLTLPDDVFARLVPRALTYSWHLTSRTPLGVILSEHETRYVLVSREDRKVDLLMPESLYTHERATSAGVAP